MTRFTVGDGDDLGSPGESWKNIKINSRANTSLACSSCGGCDENRTRKAKNRQRNLFEEKEGNNNHSTNVIIYGNQFVSWTFAIMSVVLFVISSGIVVGGVGAIDLHPHGGMYHKEGGNDFYSSSQQSEFGGDDMIMTCSRPIKSSRAAKYLAIKQLDIPCDMGDRKSAWCNLPGEKYPWHAVRRFVFENQGLMRRMYGEVRQLSLLRMEFEEDLDDEVEEERQGPPRAPMFSEDHRRNSILTEVLDESLPRILSESSPEDQLLLRDHLVRSTPRSSPSTSASPSTSTMPSSATPVMSSSSSEELRLISNDTTEAMIGVTIESISSEVNGTTTGDLLETSPGSGDGSVTASMGSNFNVRNGLLDELVTEEATQATAGVTESDNNDEEAIIVTTTEEMSGFSEDETPIGEQVQQLQVIQQQQLNDGLDVGSSGGVNSDEFHSDFLNLDKNHILYFDDVGKNRRPVVGGGNGDAEAGFVPQQQQQQPGKLKAVNACPVKEEVVAPYWANNTRGEILALLNLYPFEQYIHWERCNHENKQMFCRQGCRCEQQYRLHRLLAFDPTNECRGIFSDWFRFPSCCVCRCYLNEYELMMLNAAGQEPSASSASSKSRSDRIRSPRKLLLDQLVDGPDVQGVDDMHFFYKQGVYAEHNHAQPRRKR